MNQKLTIFEYRFNDDELERDFNDVFYQLNLLPLFTHEHRSTPIKVGYNDARGAVNAHGSWRKDLKELSDVISWSQDNQSFDEVMLKLIHTPKDFNGMMRKIRKMLDFIKNQIKDDHIYNMWNIVWYSKILN